MDWLQQNTGIFVALIAAVSAVIGAIVGSGARFFFEFYLSERLKQRWKLIETKRRYSSPIIHAADSLSGRIDNLNQFLPRNLATEWLQPLTDDEVEHIPFKGYYYVSSVFAFVRFIAWVEILRREQIFLDFSSIKETREFNAYLNLIYAALSAPNFTSGKQDREPKDHWIYFHYISGIAEAVTKRDELVTLRCLTLQEFCIEYQKNPGGKFRLWVMEIERLVVGLSSDPEDLRWKQIQILWFCLDSFLDFVDPKRIQATRVRHRSKNVSAELQEIAIKRADQLGLRLRRI